MRLLSARDRGTCRFLSGLVVRAAVLLLAPMAVSGQSGFVHDEYWDEIGPIPGGGPFGKTLLCELDANGVWDAVVVSEGEVLVLLDPGRRTKWISLDPAHQLSDVALLPRGGGDRDALVTAGSNGVVVWTWDELQPAPVVCRYVVTQTAATRVLAHGFSLPSAANWWAVEFVTTSSQVHPLLLNRSSNGSWTQVPYPSWSLGQVTGPMVLADCHGDVAPELMVARATGVEMRGFDSSLLASFAGTNTVALVRAGKVNGHDRVAWFRHQDGTPSASELILLQGTSQSTPAPLAGLEIASASAYDGSTGCGFVLGLADGTAFVLPPACGGSSPPYSFACGSQVGHPKYRFDSWPIVADLDLMPCDDALELLAFDDSWSTAWLMRGLVPMPDTVTPEIEIDETIEIDPGTFSLRLDVNPPASCVRVTSYRWVLSDPSMTKTGPTYDVPVISGSTSVTLHASPYPYNDVLALVAMADPGGAQIGLASIYVADIACLEGIVPPFPARPCSPIDLCPAQAGTRGVIQIPGGPRCTPGQGCGGGN